MIFHIFNKCVNLRPTHFIKQFETGGSSILIFILLVLVEHMWKKCQFSYNGNLECTHAEFYKRNTFINT